MASIPFRPASPILALALAACSLLASGCGPSPEQLFRDSLAREALSCLHPRGEFQSAGEVRSEGSDSFVGTIYWRGRALDANYYTKVRVRLAGDVAEIGVIEETSIVPATPGCRVTLIRK